MYVVFKRCLPVVTLGIGVCVLKNGIPSVGVITAVLITTGGAALAGSGDVTGDTFGYVTGVLAVIIHASYLVLIQKTSTDSEYGPLTAQYSIAIMSSPVLLICSIVSMDSINMWSYTGWSNPFISGIFSLCIVIGCAMNFTTLQCTYINSAVTTSFVGVVKSIATITVGMVAFSDVEPTSLFVAGVVVNTVGSITYCIVKYFDTRRKTLYQDLEEQSKDESLPGQTYIEKKPPNGDLEPLPNGHGWSGDGSIEQVPTQDHLLNDQSLSDYPIPDTSNSMESVELQSEAFRNENRANQANQSVSDSYLRVWRSIRNLQFLNKDTLIDNMEVQSP
uniref:Solute carrier family 35 member D3 n=1 Tax=Hucho hucho TaxID=62062 RepID=A0A4W5JR23_9TELE